MTFILYEMTFLRYFIPLIIEGNKRGIESTMYIFGNHKYNNPLNFLPIINDLASKYHFKCIQGSENTKTYDTSITIEGVGRHHCKGKIIVLTYMSDFRTLYQNYYNDVDKIILLSKPIATHFNTLGEKNLYYGSPKYDIVLKRDIILDKYDISTEKPICTFIYPNSLYPGKFPIRKYIEYLQETYFVIVKGRGKDRAPFNLRGDMYIEDQNWYPHPSIELFYISNLVITPDSTSIKELVLLQTPFINLECKPHKNPFYFLLHPSFSKSLTSLQSENFNQAVLDLQKTSFCILKDGFNQIIKKYLFTGNTSEKIIDLVESFKD